MAWRTFNWGSRGPHAEALTGVYVNMAYIPGCIQGTLFSQSTETGQQYLNVIDFEAPAPAVNVADCQAVCNLIIDWWVNRYRNICHDGVRAIRAAAVARDQFEGATYEINMSTDGVRIGTHLSGQQTLKVKYAGNNWGRSRRGGHYMFPGVEADKDPDDPDQFTNTYVNNAVATMEYLRLAAQTAGYPVRIASTVRRQLYPVTRSVVTDLLMDSQRRRAEGRGR